ncbi:STAS domain-containing protein [Streptomyces sp. NPDC050617]|uniref:STAS domain-containing protein n=1 Tax=Streptomyces sp. NPDC050617 TaxID=3154628 RepID=UPI00343E717F
MGGGYHDGYAMAPVGDLEYRAGSHLRLHTHATYGFTVAEPLGEIDIATAAEVRPLLDAVTEGPAPTLAVDLSATTFFDCAGLSLLARLHTRITERGGRLYLVCDQPLTLRMLRIVGMDERLRPAPTLEAALARAS